MGACVRIRRCSAQVFQRHVRVVLGPWSEIVPDADGPADAAVREEPNVSQVEWVRPPADAVA